MDVPACLVAVCLVLLMVGGGFVVVFSLTRLTQNARSPSRFTVPGLKLEIRGPAWLISATVGAVMLASPVLAVALQRPANVTTAPASVKRVQSIPDPNYKDFRFLRDISVVDLRSVTVSPWYTHLPGWKLVDPRPRIRPASLTNHMVVRKVGSASEIHLVYSTSARLDLRCVTHAAGYHESRSGDADTWEVIADVSAVPIGSQFEIIIEATYWGGFWGSHGNDYTTYGHNQSEPEDLSILLLFPEKQPFKSVTATEYGPHANEAAAAQGSFEQRSGERNRTYYWHTISTRPSWFYKLTWTW